MNRVLEHESGDLTCTVEAGIRLSALAAALAPSSQRLSLDPPGDPTIGACLACDLSGPLRHRFGAPRDLVLGVTLVLADGTIVNAGGKVVKNVRATTSASSSAAPVAGSRSSAASASAFIPTPVAASTVVVERDDAASVYRSRCSRTRFMPAASRSAPILTVRPSEPRRQSRRTPARG